MAPIQKLYWIKLIHTFIWMFFVSQILYVIYSGVFDRTTLFTWIAIGFVILEGLVLLLFGGSCPLTVMARKYSDSDKYNFDIFLPEWLAKYNKEIFTTLFLIGLFLVIYHEVSH